MFLALRKMRLTYTPLQAKPFSLYDSQEGPLQTQAIIIHYEASFWGGWSEHETHAQGQRNCMAGLLSFTLGQTLFRARCAACSRKQRHRIHSHHQARLYSQHQGFWTSVEARVWRAATAFINCCSRRLAASQNLRLAVTSYCSPIVAPSHSLHATHRPKLHPSRIRRPWHL